MVSQKMCGFYWATLYVFAEVSGSGRKYANAFAANAAFS